MQQNHSPDHSRSLSCFAKAQQLMPGGVSSPVRAFKGVGGNPLFIQSGKGPWITDVDGNQYVDYVGSYGPLVVGHGHDAVVAAVSSAMSRGSCFGAPTEGEINLAEIITNALPAVEMIRFVNSGTEATMSALRLARATTGRDLVVKCIGCYHGHVDSLLVEAGSGALTLGIPSSPGVPKSIASNTLLVHYNDLEGTRQLFQQYAGKIACICLEAICGNMGVVKPVEGYLNGLRKLCDEHGIMLVFDEVMTGFRVDFGGAQTLYHIRPDITCLGKIIGGGLPVGAYGGRRDLMARIAPSGPVYQAGTLSGNPLAMAAGIATLNLCAQPNFYRQLEEKSRYLAKGLEDAADSVGVPVVINRVGSMLTPFFTKKTSAGVSNYLEATASDTKAYAVFFHAMLKAGVYLPPSQYEAWFISSTHDRQVLDKTINAAKSAFVAVKQAGMIT